MNTAIFYRDGMLGQGELEAILENFPLSSDDPAAIHNSLVLGRYSVLPFYPLIEEGLKAQNSVLVNSYEQYNYVSRFEYYKDVSDITPDTWFDINSVPAAAAPFIVKGITNSRKHEWNKLMFAETIEDAKGIIAEFNNDPLLKDQGHIIRRYIPLKRLGTGPNGLPYSNEWRFFFCGTSLISHGFYWNSSKVKGEMDSHGLAFAEKVAHRLSGKTAFFSLDVAQTQKGEWILIEVNDGQMAGLPSSIKASDFYASLKNVLDRRLAERVGRNIKKS